jgi:hypothetical protein
MPAAIGETAELAAGGGEQSMVVIRGTRDVAGEIFPVITAWHAVMIDPGDIAGNLEVGIQRHAGIVGGQHMSPFGKILSLPQSDPAASLLALLHREAAQGRPTAKDRVLKQGASDLMAIGGRTAMGRLERAIATAFPCGPDVGHHAIGEMSVHHGKVVQPLHFIVRHVGKHRVAADPAVIRRAVILCCRFRRLL